MDNKRLYIKKSMSPKLVIHVPARKAPVVAKSRKTYGQARPVVRTKNV